jgi:hypothetical protein
MYQYLDETVVVILYGKIISGISVDLKKSKNSSA